MAFTDYCTFRALIKYLCTKIIRWWNGKSFITNRMQACCNGSIVNYYFIIINVRRPAPHYTTALSAQLCPWPVWIVWDQLRLQYVSSCRPVLTGSSTCWRQTIHRHVSHLSVVCDSVSFIPQCVITILQIICYLAEFMYIISRCCFVYICSVCWTKFV